MKIEIRELRGEDIGALAEIESKSFSMPWSEDAFADLLKHDYCFYLVAVADGEVAGCCGYTDTLGQANIDNVVVAEQYRNLGVAQMLLKELIRRGGENNINDYTLEVRVSNAAAIHVYEKFGFVSEGVRPNFYEKPTEDALIMWRRKK